MDKELLVKTSNALSSFSSDELEEINKMLNTSNPFFKALKFFSKFAVSEWNDSKFIIFDYETNEELKKLSDINWDKLNLIEI